MTTVSALAAREMSWMKCELCQVRSMRMVLPNGVAFSSLIESTLSMAMGWSSVP